MNRINGDIEKDQGAEPSFTDGGDVRLDRDAVDLFEIIPGAVFQTDAAMKVSYVSSRAQDVFGYRVDEMLGRTLSELGLVIKNGDEFKKSGAEPFRSTPCLLLGRNGKVRHLSISALPLFDISTGAFAGLKGLAEDCTDRWIGADRIRMLSMAVEQSSAAVIITDRYGVIEYVNKGFVESTGFMSVEAVGRTPAILKSGYMANGVYQEMWQTLLAGREWRGELYNRKKSGEFFWENAVISPVLDEGGEIIHFVAVKENVTDRMRYQEELLRQGYEDDVTGLPNRILAIDRLEQTLARARRNGGKVALLSVNLDSFKRINDAMGHNVADQILREVGERLSSLMRPQDTVARIGGDEFCIIAGECQPSDVDTIVQRVIRGFQSAFVLGENETFVTASVGVAVFPEDGSSPGELLRNASAALHRAKENGRSSFQYFTPDMTARSAEHARLETALHHALDRNEIAMHYQAIIDISTGKVSAAEALMRWESPEYGTVPPDSFIPLAESSGLIVPLGTWAMMTACKQAAEWCRVFGPDFRMAVNVSTRQVRQQSFGEMVRMAIEETGISPRNLEIEITESLLLDHGNPVEELLRLRESGVRLSIDDFGTGYSALSYLRRFPVDTLKIDKSFLSNMADNSTDAMLVETIITMAHNLGLDVIAEGVETNIQLSTLKGRRCNQAQGFLISKPVPAHMFLEMVAAGLKRRS